jgi:transposase
LCIHKRFCYLTLIVSEISQPSTTSTPIPSPSPADAAIIADLKQQLDTTQQRLDSMQQRLQFAELKVQMLEEKLRLQRIAKYGPSSEKLATLQMELLEEEPGVSDEEVQAESQRERLPSTRNHRKHPGRQSLPATLPRLERVIACTTEQCVCGQCGAETAVIGYEESEHLDVEPPKYFVVVTKREKRACKHCEEQGVSAAPLPPRIIEKSLVSDRVVIDTLINKYSSHLPLYRQSAILLRDVGVEISRATMDGWVMQVGESLIPLVEAMRQELIRSGYIQADETPVGVQMHDRRGRNHQGYLWQYGSPGREVVFDFRMSRAREGPRQFLKKFQGLLQTDGYAAYDGLGGARVIHAACWAHARRKLVESVRLNPKDGAAIDLLQLVNDLFAIDAQAREENLDLAARNALRQDMASPLLQEIKVRLLEGREKALPKSCFGKACRYALNLWDKLTRFLDHPELELSNNLAENSMRPVALGRRNWIHLGDEKAGPKVAAILSIIESCRRLHIPVRDYLAAILPGLNDLPIQRVTELTPAAWARERSRLS